MTTNRQLPELLDAYQWPPSSEELARAQGLAASDILRFDGNVAAAPSPSARPGAVAAALADVNEYDRGRYHDLRAAVAEHHGVGIDQVVLGAGSDELIVACARTFASGGTVATVPEFTYPMYRFAAGMAGATLLDDATVADLVYVCRPNNPTGELVDVPEVGGQLVIDEAYAEYADVDELARVANGAIVLRTFSKAHGLAGARVGYAICDAQRSALLASRLPPLSVASPSAALALASLRHPPDVRHQIEERERLCGELAELGLVALPSSTNFLYVPTDDPRKWHDALLPYGVVIRVYPEAIRISVRDRDDDEVLLDAIRSVRSSTAVPDRLVRERRITAETRIEVRLRLRGEGRVHVATGAGLYDHLLEQLAFHGHMDLRVRGVGDLENGEHHTVEDTMLALGDAIDRALGDRRGIARYGESRIPMDEAVAHAIVDLSGRPFAEVAISPDPGMATHALESLAQHARMTLHLEATGRNDHHTAEVAYKAVGRALAIAVARGDGGVTSTKGSL
jgi:histidinol-phosphate/aromatic aminotransferase/cobyric acid decarboxylase-like protein/imidazoleglycerol phosphate dehydratase HisB